MTKKKEKDFLDDIKNNLDSRDVSITPCNKSGDRVYRWMKVAGANLELSIKLNKSTYCLGIKFDTVKKDHEMMKWRNPSSFIADLESKEPTLELMEVELGKGSIDKTSEVCIYDKSKLLTNENFTSSGFDLLKCADWYYKIINALKSLCIDKGYVIEAVYAGKSSKKVATTAATLGGTMEKRNLIYYGAPGTGKSYELNKERKAKSFADYERVTFSPDYSYANFVGSYKPVPTGSGGISYRYVPGPFMRVYVKAINNPEENFLLVIEEINRANAAAVFGEVFQLLDRDKTGRSEYPIAATEEMQTYLDEVMSEELKKGAVSTISQLALPPNMYIWATMNNADQGVMPLDTAFKRRWDFKYIGIDAGESVIANQMVDLCSGDAAKTSKHFEWNKIRKSINARLSELKVNEDKLIGPFFLRDDIVPYDSSLKPVMMNKADFDDAFKTKIIMYIYEDAAKTKRKDIFACDVTKLSEIFQKYETDGLGVFCDEIRNNC